MNFLAPLFLIGAAAIAGPILFHLIRRTTQKERIFSSLLFLQSSPPRLTRRSRIEDWLLLILRAAALVLLACGFARPFLKLALPPDPAPEQPSRSVILVDTSASMRRDNLWKQARDRAEAAIRRARPGDEVALWAFDRQVKPLITFEEWNSTPPADRAAAAVARLDAASPTWMGTHLGAALAQAAEALVDPPRAAPGGRRQIVLVSDLQDGSHLDQIQGFDWPHGLELDVQALRPARVGNAGLQVLGEVDDAFANASLATRVRVINSSDAKREQFQVGWARPDGLGFVGESQTAYVPPGQSRVIVLNTNRPNAASGRIRLSGDDEDFDNAAFQVAPERSRSRVLYFGSESETDPKQPLFFLERAFQETRHRTIEIVHRNTGNPPNPDDLANVALVVVADPLASSVSKDLRKWIESGGTVLVALKSTAAGPTVADLAGVGELGLDEIQPSNYAMLGEIDFRHPLFAPFSDPRYSDFTRIHFWRYRHLRVDDLPGARILARFDRGDPALLELSIGRGKLLVLTSAWHPADSQLALSSKFVPLLYSMLDQSGNAEPRLALYEAGDRVPIPSGTTVTAPEGSRLQPDADGTNFSQTMTPGLYKVSDGSTFAVNLDPAESRTAPMAGDQLERLGAPVIAHAEDPTRNGPRMVNLRSIELEGRQKLWRWFVAATLTVLAAETWLAGRKSRAHPQAATVT